MEPIRVIPERIFTPEEIHAEFDNILAERIPEACDRVSKKYSNSVCLRLLPLSSRVEIVFQCFKLNSFHILKAISIGTSVGIGTGAIAGFVIGHTVCPIAGGVPGMLALSATGATVGLGVAVGYCAHNDLFNDATVLTFVVKKSSEYQEFKSAITVEHYKIFLDFVSNYFNCLPDDAKDVIEDFICPITCEIPANPVFAPYDLERKVPYEKEEIEKHLDIIEMRIARAVESGMPEEEIEDIKSRADTLGRGYFTKDQLFYDRKFALKVIKVLRTLHGNLREHIAGYAKQAGLIGADLDPLLEKAVDMLKRHYETTYQYATKASISFLRNDIIKLGASYEKATEIGDAFYAANKNFYEPNISGFYVKKNAEDGKFYSHFDNGKV